MRRVTFDPLGLHGGQEDILKGAGNIRILNAGRMRPSVLPDRETELAEELKFQLIRETYNSASQRQQHAHTVLDDDSDSPMPWGDEEGNDDDQGGPPKSASAKQGSAKYQNASRDAR
jgi:hypothetical protein